MSAQPVLLKQLFTFRVHIVAKDDKAIALGLGEPIYDGPHYWAVAW